MAALLLENNLAKHCEVWVSENIYIHFQKFVMNTEKKKLDFFFLNYAAGQEDCRDELDEQM